MPKLRLKWPKNFARMAAIFLFLPMKLRSLQDAKVKGKRVLLRVDFNVTLRKGKIEDDTRIVKTLPTIKYLLKQGAKVILISHLGRPDGKDMKELRMDGVAKHLSKLLKKKVKKMDECVGPKVQKSVDAMKSNEVIMLENVRFYKEEEKNSLPFAKKLAALADLYVNDSFGTAHRAHASTCAVAKLLPAYAGFLVQKEVKILGEVLNTSKGPLTLIVGGAKIDTKIGLLRNFVNRADYFLIGGGLANTFLAAEGYDIGSSLYEKEKIGIAQNIMMEAENAGENFVLPEDAVVADEITDQVPSVYIPVEDVEGNMRILDIGPGSRKKFEQIIRKSKTIIWNGPVGLFEYKAFSKGTETIARALAGLKGVKTIIGGGDTIDAIHHFGIDEKKFTHVSTGGGAMLEFLEGDMLPGIEILLKSRK